MWTVWLWLRQRRRVRGGWTWAVSVAILGFALLSDCRGFCLPHPGAPAAGTSSQTTADGGVRTLTGRVLNAVNGAPVPRALVSVAGRSVLTDAEGKFSFESFTGPQAYVLVTKPGYSQSPDSLNGISATLMPLRDAPIELKLYPEAVITGTLADQNGLPLEHVQVGLSQAVYDASGLHSVAAGFGSTNSRGEFRFTHAAGRFQVNVPYQLNIAYSGKALLPAQFPDDSSGVAARYSAVGAGEELRQSLSVQTSATVPLKVVVKWPRPDGGMDLQNGLQIQAKRRDGGVLQLFGQPSGTPNELRFSLPPGPYTLRVTSSSREESFEGQAEVTVDERGSSSVVVGLLPLTHVPIEVSVSTRAETGGAASASPSFTAPTPGQLNLILRPVDSAINLERNEVHLQSRPDHSFEFRPPAGHYRLEAAGIGAWYVESAFMGATDLMTHDLAIASGSTSGPLRLTVDNRVGRIDGHVRLSGDEPICWIYLIPRMASLTALFQMRVTAEQAAFSLSVPPGRYTVVALGERLQDEVTAPGPAQAIASRGKEIEVANGGIALVDLDVAVIQAGTR